MIVFPRAANQLHGMEPDDVAAILDTLRDTPCTAGTPMNDVAVTRAGIRNAPNRDSETVPKGAGCLMISVNPARASETPGRAMDGRLLLDAMER